MLTEYIRVDRSIEDDNNDCAIAFHIIVLCAEILSYCYGDESRSAAAWEELSDRAELWLDTKPASFEPIRNVAARSAEGQVFPEIWLLNDCHGKSPSYSLRHTRPDESHTVAAHQHYLICRILLSAHDPRRPQLGPGRAEAADRVNVRTLAYLVSLMSRLRLA